MPVCRLDPAAEQVAESSFDLLHHSIVDTFTRSSTATAPTSAPAAPSTPRQSHYPPPSPTAPTTPSHSI